MSDDKYIKALEKKLKEARELLKQFESAIAQRDEMLNSDEYLSDTEIRRVHAHFNSVHLQVKSFNVSVSVLN